MDKAIMEDIQVRGVITMVVIIPTLALDSLTAPPLSINWIVSAPPLSIKATGTVSVFYQQLKNENIECEGLKNLDIFTCNC